MRSIFAAEGVVADHARVGSTSHGQLGVPLQLYRRQHRLHALVSRSDGLRERGLEALIGRDLRVLLIGHAYRRLQ